MLFLPALVFISWWRDFLLLAILTEASSFYNSLIPNDHVDVSIEITAGHLALEGAIALRWEDDDVDEVLKFIVGGVVLADGPGVSNIALMAARIPCDQNIACNVLEQGVF